MAANVAGSGCGAVGVASGRTGDGVCSAATAGFCGFTSLSSIATSNSKSKLDSEFNLSTLDITVVG